MVKIILLLTTFFCNRLIETIRHILNTNKNNTIYQLLIEKFNMKYYRKINMFHKNEVNLQ